MGRHRMAPADARYAGKNFAEAFLLRYLWQARARIGDGHEMPAGLPLANERNDLRPEIIEEDVGLERSARLAGHDEQRALQIDPVLQRADLLGIGGVEYVKCRSAGSRAQRSRQHFGAQARSAHAEQQNVAKIFGANFPSEGGQAIEAAELVIDNVEPVEPVALVASRPKPRVPAPEPAHFAFGPPNILRFPELASELVTEQRRLVIELRPGVAAALGGGR